MGLFLFASTLLGHTSLSAGFQQVDWNGKNRVVFPAQMKFDYVRLYQPHGQPARVSCDPPDHPTADYIQRHLDLYYNPNLTSASLIPTCFSFSSSLIPPGYRLSIGPLSHPIPSHIHPALL